MKGDVGPVGLQGLPGPHGETIYVNVTESTMALKNGCCEVDHNMDGIKTRMQYIRINQ